MPTQGKLLQMNRQELRTLSVIEIIEMIVAELQSIRLRLDALEEQTGWQDMGMEL
jgi:hypothetical protein